MEEVLLLFKEVDRIKAICLSSHAIIDLFRSILIPDAPFSGGFPEVVFKSFSQAINIVWVNFGSYLNVEQTENNVLFISWEKRSVVGFSHNPEIKGFLGELKGDCWHVDGVCWIGEWIDREGICGWDFIQSLIDVSYLEVEIVECMYLESEQQLGYYWACRLFVKGLVSCVLKGQSNIWWGSIRGNYFVFWFAQYYYK